ncbi:MAG: DUF1360 domain-containing protein [Actinomycetota bacterium]|nr:DUF1360 domain-containing protein [Actinomycetota bacterium]
MKPVSETPTKPLDYALLSGTYSSLLALSAIGGRSRAPIERAELIPLGVATFALSKLLVQEKVETWVRQPFVEETSDGKRPKGKRLRYAVGELLTCTRCAGGWSALAVVSLRVYAPTAANTVTSVLAVSACNDLLHTTFSWLRSQSNETEATAEIARTRADVLQEPGADAAVVMSAAQQVA